MSSNSPIRDSILSDLNEKQKTMKESRVFLFNKFRHMNQSLKEIELKHAKMINDDSPLLKLPTEVTCMIFDLYYASHFQLEPKSEKRPLPPEVVVSHVCKQWREASLGYPRLWTRFFFRAVDVDEMTNAYNLFDMYIRRSRSQNLELFFDFNRPALMIYWERELEELALIDMAVKQIKRWKIVTFLSGWSTEIEQKLEPELFMGFAPNLEYFAYAPTCMNVNYVNIDDSTATQRSMITSRNPTIFQGGAPKLRYVLLDSSSPSIPPLSNLTTLRIEPKNTEAEYFYSWIVFLQILSIPSLTNLSLAGDIFARPTATNLPVIVMKNLKHLRSLDFEMSYLLPFLRAPLLETLSLNDSELEFPFDPQEDHYFFPSLHTLILVENRHSYHASWCLIRRTRNIKSIVMSDRDFNLNILVNSEPESGFDNECWPKLTSCTANFPELVAIDILVDFCRSRSQNTFNLRLLRGTHLAWEAESRDAYNEIRSHCAVEVIDEEEDAMKDLLWSPRVNYPDYAFKPDRFII